MALTLPHTFVAGGALDPSEVNDNFQAVTNKVSGGIVNEDISGSANINVDKLSGQFERVSLQLPIQKEALSATTKPQFLPFNMPNDNLYTVDSISWALWGDATAGIATAIGGTRTGRLRWATITTAGALDVTGNTIFSGVAFGSNCSGNITPAAQPDNLTGTNVRGFYFDLTTASGSAPANGLLLTINLKRKIQAS